MRSRSLFLAVSATTLAAALGSVAVVPVAASAAPNIQLKWSEQLSSSGGDIAQSSPMVATLDGGGPAVLVGDRGGRIYAMHLTNGSEVAGWPATTGGVAVDSAPSSSGTSVYVGEGTSSAPSQGGNAKFSASGGSAVWVQHPVNYPGNSSTVGVQTGLAIGNLQGQQDVVSGSMGQYTYALNAGSGAVLGGWPFLNADSDFTTPAIADLYGNGQNEVVEGGDSTGNPAAKDQLGNTYTEGGHVRVLNSSGTLLCEDNTNQTVDSSPAVGEFLGGNQVGIAVGTGNQISGASQTDTVLGLNSRCGQAWSTLLDGDTISSPALVNATGNGSLDVAEGTAYGANGSANGTVYLLNGTNGHVIWQSQATGGIFGGLTSVDLGGGYQDIVAATTSGAEIFDGKTGKVVWSALAGQVAFQNTPLVTDDPNGTIGLTFAGYGVRVGTLYSFVDHYEVAGSSGAHVNEAGAWPMFHHDAQETGDAGTPRAVIRVPCSAPRSAAAGYWLAASDGGIFTFGDLPFCGSTGSIVLNKPIVGIAGTSNGGGYWLVATDGGIFNFGNAGFFGSTGNIRLNQPIVGMAPTPDGKGYWLVASDGGIFTFGDAKYHGSTGNIRLNRPIVGMASTSDGNGYWLVATDGGIFTFGDAKYHGSTGNIKLNRPIVGMHTNHAGTGYWLVATDGGIFTFGEAKYYGSTGNIKLNRPIVGMAGY